ncbi:MAG: ArdC-like ssDNA-binding domain-containing protein [Saprospiraceae bacterium]
MNQLILSYVANKNKYAEPYRATFNAIKKAGGMVRK